MKEIIGKYIIGLCEIDYTKEPEEWFDRLVYRSRRVQRQIKAIRQDAIDSRIYLIKWPLEEFGVDINYQEGQALVNACKCNYAERLVEFLIERGADVNAQNGKCMENAAEAEAWETLELLLDNGAKKAGNSISILLNQMTQKRHNTKKIIYFVGRIDKCCKE